MPKFKIGTQLFLLLILVIGPIGTAQAEGDISVFDIISGSYARHSQAYFEQVIAKLELEKEAGSLSQEGAVMLSRAYARSGQAQGIELYKAHMATGADFSDSLHMARLFTMAGNPQKSLEMSGLVVNDSGLKMQHPAWNLQMIYLQKFSNDHEGPVFPKFNGGFGNFLSDSLKWGEIELEEMMPALLTLLWQIVEDSPHNPILYELLGDLLYQTKTGDEMRYLAAFAYQRASQLTFSEDAEDAYRRKAVFAMEGNLVRNPFFYNKIRYADMEIAFLKEQEVAVALEERILEDEKKWASEGKDMEKAFLGAYADRIPSFLSAGEIDLWPENPGVAFEFTSKEVENERSRTSYTPNDEITNPSLDISAVKKDYRFNLYALIVFAFLFGALGIIWYKFRKMEKLQREKEELEQ